MQEPLPRRNVLKTLATGAAAVAASQAISTQARAAHHGGTLKGNINHAVCKWCYKGIELDPFCKAVSEMGIKGVDLINVKDFPTLEKYGLACSMVSGVPGGIKTGLNREENHDAIIEFFEESIPIAAKAGYKRIVCFSGNRDGMNELQGLANCAKGLRQIAPIAEKHGITIIMELLNSKVNHADYMCDNSRWGVALCDAVGSESFKMLYDIYHMQIMEGDLIATIRKNHRYYGHYHTGGVPGRNEIDATQELYYPAIMEAILETGYDGYVAQEFIPAGPDPLASLKEAIHICDV